LDFLARHSADTLLNCLLQAEAVKNRSPGPPEYTVSKKNLTLRRNLLYLQLTPAISGLFYSVNGAKAGN
jgi:hypothetical protein